MISRAAPNAARTRVYLAAFAVIASALIWAPPSNARGGTYVVKGGTAYERLQVTRALAVSSFDWGVVSGQVTIHIDRGIPSLATPGHIWLDADLLDAGTYSWGVVQHEYAHQVDYLLLADADRALLLTTLGGTSWCSEESATPHAAFGCERFASTLAWSYWTSPENCMRPQGPDDESAALPPRKFRALLADLLADRTASPEVLPIRP